MSNPTGMLNKRRWESNWASSTGWIASFALQFDGHPASDDQVGAKSALQLDAAIDQGNRLLAFDGESEFLEFVRQAGFIGRLQQSRAELSVKGDRGADDFGR